MCNEAKFQPISKMINQIPIQRIVIITLNYKNDKTLLRLRTDKWQTIETVLYFKLLCGIIMWYIYMGVCVCVCTHVCLYECDGVLKWESNCPVPKADSCPIQSFSCGKLTSSNLGCIGRIKYVSVLSTMFTEQRQKHSVALVIYWTVGVGRSPRASLGRMMTHWWQPQQLWGGVLFLTQAEYYSSGNLLKFITNKTLISLP